MVENEIREEPGLSLLDIWNILIKNTVESETGVTLEPEVIVLR